MMAVHAYIREHLAEHVIAELQAAGCEKISVLEVRGISRHVAFEATEPSVSLAQRVERVVKLEIIGSDAETSSWADVIAAAARTGRAGDGLVCILPIMHAASIHIMKSAKGG